MLIRRLPVVITTPLNRDPQRVARRNAARAALEARQRRLDREDVEAFLERVAPAQRRQASAQRE